MTAPLLPAGTIVAQKYRIASTIGFSGAAATYLASSADGREVVLKMFDPALRQRADIMGAIEQVYAGTNALPPEISVPLLDAGYDGGTGAPFSVVDRMPIPSLAQILSQQVLSLEDTSRMLAAVATALDQAHRRGLVHHALKPTNIFLASPQAPLVRIGDFGASLPRTAVPTQEGYNLAVPWLAPEQMQAAEAGPEADVFSLALIAFFALTGRSYWLSCQGTPDLGSWQQELMGGRTPPSARAQQLGAVVSPALDAVLGAGLAVDPNQRYRSAGDFAQAFEAAAGQQGDAQATMAYQGALGGQGDYPPAPRPLAGGYQDIPPPRPPVSGAGWDASQGGGPQGYMAVSQPPQGYGPAPMGNGPQSGPYPGSPNPLPPSPPIPQPVPGMQSLHGQAGQGGQGGYVSTQTPAVSAHGISSSFDETAIGKPALGAAVPPRARSNRLVAALVGVVAVGLLSAAVGAWFIMGRSHDGVGTAPSAVAVAPSSSPSTEAAPSSAPSTDPAATAAASASAAPAPSDTPSSVPSADPAAAATGAVTVTCDPDCDELKVDDNAVEAGKSIDLPVGSHVVIGSKSGYSRARETIVVKAGDKLDKTLKLKAATAATAPPPKKPCGKFLQRGAGCK